MRGREGSSLGGLSWRFSYGYARPSCVALGKSLNHSEGPLPVGGGNGRWVRISRGCPTTYLPRKPLKAHPAVKVMYFVSCLLGRLGGEGTGPPPGQPPLLGSFFFLSFFLLQFY